jgi:hypothetical protein
MNWQPELSQAIAEGQSKRTIAFNIYGKASGWSYACRCGESWVTSYSNHHQCHCDNSYLFQEWDDSCSQIHIYDHPNKNMCYLVYNDGVTHEVSKAYAARWATRLR